MYKRVTDKFKKEFENHDLVVSYDNGAEYNSLMKLIKHAGYWATYSTSGLVAHVDYPPLGLGMYAEVYDNSCSFKDLEKGGYVEDAEIKPIPEFSEKFEKMFKEEAVRVRCDTFEQAMGFVTAAKRAGVYWPSCYTKEDTEVLTRWGRYKHRTCYYCEQHTDISGKGRLHRDCFKPEEPVHVLCFNNVKEQGYIRNVLHTVPVAESLKPAKPAKQTSRKFNRSRYMRIPV